MRQDQYERLQQLEERLLDVFLGEAEPDKWPGHGIEPGAMTKDTRGDRYWCKRNAVATLSLASRIGHVIGQVQGAGTVPPAAEGEGDDEGAVDLDAEVAAAEAEAVRLLDQVQKSARREDFVKRAAGSRKAG